MAQPGSAPEWGSGGRRFESCRPDQFFLLHRIIFECMQPTLAFLHPGTPIGGPSADTLFPTLFRRRFPVRGMHFAWKLGADIFSIGVVFAPPSSVPERFCDS